MTITDVKSIFNDINKSFAVFFTQKKLKLVIHNEVCSPEMHSVRDVAWADSRDMSVNIVKRVLDFSDDAIIALLRHEIAHSYDTYSALSGREQRADDLAELVCGDKIRYSGPMLIQTIGNGIYPRPLELPR